MFSNSYVILLTACINPNGMAFTYLQDSKVREKQYIDAIKYYLTNTNYKIVFCNISGEDISSNIPIGRDRIEFLSFFGNDYDRDLGKGYGEYLILKYAFRHSKFLEKAKYVIKITGRLIIDNVSDVLKFNDIIFCFPTNKIYVLLHDKKQFADSRFFVATKSFYDIFLQQKNAINDKQEYYFEHLLYDVIKEHKANFLCSDFCLSLVLNGISGSTGQIYSSADKSQIQKLIDIRNFCELIKQQHKHNWLRYSWISVTSFIIRIQKLILRKFI